MHDLTPPPTAQLVYAGFWQRFAAIIIDGLVILPPSLLLEWVAGYSRIAALLVELPTASLYFVYCIYGHGRFGKTLGKYIMGIRVAGLDGGPITWRQAWLRSSVDLLFSVILSVLAFISLAEISDAAFLTPGHWNRHAIATSVSIPDWFIAAQVAWALSEVVVMLFNQQRRALHDFIADTVVLVERRSRNRPWGSARPRDGAGRPL